ncbi:MAG: DUF362 domain-containing protein [Deltaproteobacteria bacterium]|nr:DUF362 domain-containing protein [Deltaproteobacteria bacterium]MBW2536345.1 DUF362 domain-containing protein [Deltaproteobacteria bacterium]
MSLPKPKVILRHCDTYDADRIREIAREALEELDLVPRGRVLVKPNLVAALKGYWELSYTRPEVADGVLGALRDRDEGEMTELAVGERGGITMPTRLMWKQAGYEPVVRKHAAKRYFYDEVTQVPVQLRHPDRLRDVIYAPEPVVQADFFVNLPKFKAHPWTTVTFGAKNYIGLQDDRHRLIDHDHRLNEKVADLQELVQPKFLCIDGITAGMGRMLTPKPRQLNLLVFGNNQPAVDAVGCHILGIDPHTVDHVRLCGERGYGTIELDQIELSGDVTLAEAQQRADNYEVGLIRVEDFSKGTPVTAVAGPPPQDAADGTEGTEYCWGGCPGCYEEAWDIVSLFEPDAEQTMRKVTLVFGAYQGDLELEPGEKVAFIGDCCRWEGELDGEPVKIDSCYTQRRHRDPHTASMTDIYIKMARFYETVLANRNKPYVRIPGCPVSVAEVVLTLVSLGKTKNPYFLPSTVVPFCTAWTGWRMNRMWRAATGRPYMARDREPIPAPATPAAFR